jgi:hypothetical protein
MPIIRICPSLQWLLKNPQIHSSSMSVESLYQILLKSDSGKCGYELIQASKWSSALTALISTKLKTAQ